MLSEKEIERYDRQIMIFGVDGQEKLKSAKVAVIGVGGLGSPVAYYLAAAGIGTILLVDEQKPELSNLNRQILHWEEDIERNPKSLSAKWKLERFNSEVKIETFVGRLTEENIEDVLRDVDVIVDCLDNFETRFLLDDYAQKKGIPLVHGAVEGTYGQVTTIIPGKTKSLREIFPNVGERKGKFPILGATAGVIGTLQAMEVIKLLTGIGEPLLNKLLIADLAFNTFEVVELR
ncbi:ThiF family adenylyltransferase [Thermococcus thioreducens]|uniref:Adenylyltransferase n=1 Tax=Thermococcus thioreducens TaxID=277988 RepID=A0A0Q2UM01_9EURY|nr:ThiF family adenylyltransferase [Thermococcus thioreducens]ASJ13467.1 adenylyltransferase [Thermococcus thioreducens]KQH81656.1 adenylyltransferase [Thermococcus thioreducens]SEV96771.1 Molybdopterin or thiamine biosynthesis adenylyltransferase [Thermococcus thioreducens]